MRKLGQGQSVVFCISQEIRHKIIYSTGKHVDATITTADVLSWAISETYADLRRAMPLWAVQGKRFEYQDALWNSSPAQGKRQITSSQADKFLEDESMSLEYRYHPRNQESTSNGPSAASSSYSCAINERCREFQDLSWDSANLQEEQERELAPEIEQERQIHRPAPAEPYDHHLHPELIAFVKTGFLSSNSSACQPAFGTLKCTSAAGHFDVFKFPRDLWVSSDFANTIKVASLKSVLDAYQRSVQWILVGEGAHSNENDVKVVIISPYEANLLVSRVRSSRYVSLHLYAPRFNGGFRPLDDLRLYTIPASKCPDIPPQTIMLLNLFAGQLYFDSYVEYAEMCTSLGLAWKPVENDHNTATDALTTTWNLNDPNRTGGLSTCSNDSNNLVRFLKVLFMKIRRNAEGNIDKTHMGKILGGALLRLDDFTSITLERDPDEMDLS